MSAERETNTTSEHDSIRKTEQQATEMGLVGDEPIMPSMLSPQFVPGLLRNPAIRGRGNGPVREQSILQLQRSVGNRATRAFVQRIPFGLDPPPPSADAPDIFEEAAMLNFSVPVCKNLIHHYCHAKGAEYKLAPDEMTQCNALIDLGNDQRSPQFLKFVKQMGAEIAGNAGGDPEKLKQSIESDVSFDMLGLCNTSGALGDFTVYAWGKLKVWNPDPDGSNADWSFEGQMWWYDYWDFDKRGPSGKGEPGRTAKGSWRTDMARTFLSGEPFPIKSESVPVRQVRAEAQGNNHYAKWKGNPNGEKLPVVAGIL